MDTLFLDANVLFSAAYRNNSGILQLWSLAKVKLITSTYAAEEAQRNLRELEQKERLKKLLSILNVLTVEHNNNLIPEEIILPPKDRPILSAAIAGKATHLITGDYKDFGRYYGQRIAGVIVLSPSEYLTGKLP